MLEFIKKIGDSFYLFYFNIKMNNGEEEKEMLQMVMMDGEKEKKKKELKCIFF